MNEEGEMFGVGCRENPHFTYEYDEKIYSSIRNFDGTFSVLKNPAVVISPEDENYVNEYYSEFYKKLENIFSKEKNEEIGGKRKKKNKI